MALNENIKKVLLNSQGGQTLFNKVRIIREKRAMAFVSDIDDIRNTYKKRYKRDINLKNPDTFCEKLQWLKLFYRDPVMVRCADKYEIHNYLNEIGMGYLGNEVIGVYDNANDIDFDSLPQKFAAKATHGSGWNLICKDKSKLDIKKAVAEMNSWLKLDTFVFGREWHYKDIPRRIVVEKFLDYTPLYDYKFMCFNGVPKYLQLNGDIDGKHYVDFYDLNEWKHLPITYMGFQRSPIDIEQPAQLDKMLELAAKLSADFPFVRVDFYNFEDKVILGELTFFPSSGLRPIIPEEYGYDELFGKLLTLPEPNHNLELLKKITEE